MEVREFRREDKETFLALCKDFYSSNATQRDYDEQSAVNTFDHVMDRHENLWGLLLYSSETGLAFGYALTTSYWCNEDGGNVLVLDELYIDSDHRHKGYASKLIEWMENHYRDFAVAITLEVLTSNVNACGLYAKEGYRPDGFTTYTKRIR